MSRLDMFRRLFLCLAVVGCKGGELPPPEATLEQIAREQEFLRANFLNAPCFISALDKAKPFEGETFNSPSYSVEFSPSMLIHDGLHYLVSVRKSDRVAIVARRGGYFGVNEMLGPVPLSSCMQPVFGSAV